MNPFAIGMDGGSPAGSARCRAVRFMKEVTAQQNQSQTMKRSSLTNVLSLTLLAGVWTGGSVASGAAESTPPPLALPSGPNVSLRNEVRHAVGKGLAWLEKSQDTNGF